MWPADLHGRGLPGNYYYCYYYYYYCCCCSCCCYDYYSALTLALTLALA